MSGYLYFATNATMHGLTKIGFTESILSERFAALQSTGVPVPFELFAAFRVADARACERSVHAALATFRVAANREFFRIEARDALSRVMPFVISQTSSNSTAAPIEQFSDLTDNEREVLAAYALAPSPQRPNDWEWLQSCFALSELDGRHYFDVLKQKGYLREVRGRAGAILYDLSPRGVAFGRMAHDDGHLSGRYGNENFFVGDRPFPWLTR